MPKANNFDEALEKLAAKIATEASLDATKLPDRIDSLKALTPYYALRVKERLRLGDDIDDTGAFDFTQGLPGTEEANGAAAAGVRTGPRPRRTDA